VSNLQKFFKPQKSRIYCAYLVFTHGFALLSVLLVLKFWALLFLPIITLSFLFYHHRENHIISLEHDKKTQWVLHLSNGLFERVELLPNSVMMRYFLVLHFMCINTGKKETLVLFSDSFSGNDFRSLRRCVKSGYL